MFTIVLHLHLINFKEYFQLQKYIFEKTNVFSNKFCFKSLNVMI